MRFFKLLSLFFFIALLFVFLNSYNRIFPKKIPKPFADLQINDIEKIILKSEEKIAEIFKKENHWYVVRDADEFAADEKRIENIIENIQSLQKEDIVSNNTTKREEFEIGKRTIEIKTPKKIFTLYIGTDHTSYANYVSANDEDDVFLASGFADIFISDDFRDLRVPLIQDEKFVSSITIELDGKKTTLSKKGDDWVIGEKKVKKDRVDFFINDLATLKASDMTKNKITRSGNLSIDIIEQNVKSTAVFFPISEKTYQAIISNNDFTYSIPSPYVESLKKEEKDFIE